MSELLHSPDAELAALKARVARLERLEEQVYTLVEEAAKLLYEDSLFFLLNSYTTGLSASVMEYILGVVIRDRIGGQVSSDEIGLPVKSTGYVLPCGSTAIWQR